MPITKKTVISDKKKILSESELEQREHLVNAIESLGLQEFIEYIRSPWKLLWPNFVAGVARGFGALVGATMVIGLIGWTLAITIDLPLIGKALEPYVTKVQNEFNRYIQQTNYSDEFSEMRESLKLIEENTRLMGSGTSR